MSTTQTQQYEPMRVSVAPRFTKPTAGDGEDLRSRLQPLLSGFLTDMGYNGPTQCHEIHELLQAMHEQAAKLGIPYPEDSISGRAFKVGLVYGHVSLRLPTF